MSLCSTSQTSEALAASHSLGPFFPLRLCCQGLSILLGSGTCTGSPPWPDGSRRGWSRGASECWKARESPGISCGTGRSRELQSPAASWSCGHSFLCDKLCPHHNTFSSGVCSSASLPPAASALILHSLSCPWTVGTGEACLGICRPILSLLVAETFFPKN